VRWRQRIGRDGLDLLLQETIAPARHATLKAGGRRRGNGGVASRTVVHAHRVLSHALDDAVRHDVVARNVAKLQPPPRVQTGEMAILHREGITTILTELPSHEVLRSGDRGRPPGA
jgi:hypothetical protein